MAYTQPSSPFTKLRKTTTGKGRHFLKAKEGAKRRTSYCARSKGQMSMHNIDCSKTPDKRICAARRRWNC